MHPNEAEQFLMQRISVTRQAVMLAKDYAVKHHRESTKSLITNFIRDMDATMPDPLVVHESLDPTPDLVRAADSISWQLAMCEAVWGLIHANIFLPLDSNFFTPNFSVNWTTVVRGSGGYSAGWNFNKFAIGVPLTVKLAPTWSSYRDQPLTDGDLFMREIGISSIHEEVEDSLRDAVKCFRNELFTPSLAMLAKASEGVWYELGLALASALPPSGRSTADKVVKDLNDPFFSSAKQIQLVLNLYQHVGLTPVKEASGVSERELKQSAIWADAVRESRNVVHYGVKPSMQNTYEKVAALLIGAVPHLKLMYAIYDTCNSGVTVRNANN